MKVVLAANTSWYLWNFRRHLIRDLVEKGFEVILIVPEDEFTPRLKTLEVTVNIVKISGQGMNPVKELVLFFRYLSLLKSGIHCFLGFTIKPVLYGGIAAWLLRVPTLPTITGLGTVFVQEVRWRVLAEFAYKIALASPRSVFFQNPDDRNLFLEKDLVKSHQARIVGGSGVDLAEFRLSPLSERKKPDEPVQFLMVARLLKDKGVCEFIEAAKLILQNKRPAKFLLVGPLDDGNPNSVKREVIESAVLDGVIEFKQFQHKLIPLFEACDCFVLPSYREGLPRTILEASAVGRPVITTDTPGCRRVVDHGRSGLICQPKSVQDLAEAIDDIIAMSPIQRRKMGIEGRLKIENEFSVTQVVHAYVEQVRKVRN